CPPPPRAPPPRALARGPLTHPVLADVSERALPDLWPRLPVLHRGRADGHDGALPGLLLRAHRPDLDRTPQQPQRGHLDRARGALRAGPGAAAGVRPRRRASRACARMGRMRLRIFTEPQQGASYPPPRPVAPAAEDLGFDGFFRSDHYLKMGNVSGQPGPTDAWTTLAGLATETSRIRLGTLVTCATFRLPGPLAVTVAQVDQMSGGRGEVGLGAR